MQNRNKTISIITLGCSKNQVDSEDLAGILLASNYKISHETEFADIIIINTCGFILDAKTQSIDTIMYYIDAKQKGKIQQLVVFGCMVERYIEELSSSLPEVDAFFGVNDVPKIIKWISHQKIKPTTYNRLLSTPPHYAYLKIAEGCDRFCSFCAIPSIRGKYISKPIDDIIKEAKHLVKNGVKELIIIAQDTTFYGCDLYNKQMLNTLLERLAKESNAEWIRLHYTYPSDFPLEVIDTINKYPNICKYIDIPFQHTDNEILEKMKRGHTLKDIETIVSHIRKTSKNLHIRTTFITGFPNETAKQHKELVNNLKKFKFERAGVFTYSEEEGTAAAQYKDNVSQKTKEKRLQEIMTIQEEISYQNNIKKIGNIFKVIIDEVHDSYLLARTEYDSPEIDNLVTVKLYDKQIYKQGTFVKVKIIGADSFDLLAEIVE